MLVTDDDETAATARLLRSHGMTTVTWDRHKGHAYSYDVGDLGYNYRISEINAVIGSVQLEKLEANNARRAALVARYISNLEGAANLTIPFRQAAGKSAHHIFVVLCRDTARRKVAMDRLKDRSIQSSIHYPPVHLFSYYRDRFGFAEGMLPNTEDVASRLITLPLYPTMTEEQVDMVCEVLIQAGG